MKVNNLFKRLTTAEDTQNVSLLFLKMLQVSGKGLFDTLVSVH
jgi:hypothetical protein